MRVDIGEVLTRSWQIAWQNKVLWLYGFVLSLLSFALMPIMFVLMFMDIAGGYSLDETFVFLTMMASMTLFFVVLFPLSALLNAALTFGILKAERGEEKASFIGLVRESVPFFWRYFGTMLFFVGGMFLTMFVLTVLVGVVSVVTFGFGMFCMMPLFLLQYPAMLIWYVWMEQASAAVVAGGLGVLEAMQRSWQLLRKNIWVFVLFGLVLYFGMSMLSSIVVMPMMVPFFMIPFALESPEFGQIALLISGVYLILFAPIFSIFQGGIMALMKSGWVITYLRLTRSTDEHQPILQEATA